jgi:hypothetical protein
MRYRTKSWSQVDFSAADFLSNAVKKRGITEFFDRGKYNFFLFKTPDLKFHVVKRNKHIKLLGQLGSYLFTYLYSFSQAEVPYASKISFKGVGNEKLHAVIRH